MMTIEAVRCGLTGRVWSHDPSNERLTHKDRQILFSFRMPSKGGGVTFVELRITSDSFEAIAKGMIAADRGAAIRAFGAAAKT
jgi:hypothetical protein